MKAVVTSDATKMTVLAFMHVKVKVLEVADWKYNVKFNLWRYLGHHSLRGHPNGYLRVRVLWVADFKYDVKYALRYHYISTVARESEGPLPSCYQITRISFLPLFTVISFSRPFRFARRSPAAACHYWMECLIGALAPQPSQIDAEHKGSNF